MDAHSVEGFIKPVVHPPAVQRFPHRLVIGGAFALATATAIGAASGLEDAWIALLVICALLLVIPLMNGMNDEMTGNSEVGMGAGTQVSSAHVEGEVSSGEEGGLPDPLDDGFDIPLM